MLVVLIIGFQFQLVSQALPEVFDQGTLQEQFDYLRDRTNIYNNFRAIREDMFLKVRRNSIDSILQSSQRINQLETEVANLNAQMDSISSLHEQGVLQRDAAIRDRDSFNLLGLKIGKVFYNLLLWSIIIGLIVLLATSFLIMKTARAGAITKTSEINDLKTEFEEYKKSSRERFEKQSIDHFNEIKRLKGL